MRIYLSLFLFLFLSSFSCNRRAPDNLSIDLNALKSRIKENKITILCLWTFQDGVSPNISPETYIALADSIIANKYDAHVILLNGSGGADSLIKSLNRPGLHSYYTQFVGGGYGSMDWEMIRNFITNLFPNHKWKQLKKKKFAVPVTLVVNQELKVIDEMAPRDISGLLTIVKQ
jgi:hypothetical protein